MKPNPKFLPAQKPKMPPASAKKPAAEQTETALHFLPAAAQTEMAPERQARPERPALRAPQSVHP